MKPTDMKPVEQRIQHLLEFLYGQEVGAQTWQGVRRLCEHFADAGAPRSPGAALDERDAILITYGDTFQQPGQAPLATLNEFLQTYLGDLISGVHILPFFPYSSDDGFSVIDYRQVDPHLGDWDDVRRLGQRYHLMFDLVLNHISRHSQWFQGYLQNTAPYTDYFITAEPGWDLTRVVRPRTLPLLTAVQTAQGPRQVWTTFSADQIDLNYANPQVLLEMIDLLLSYVRQGASILRLDAIAYLWKEPGTTCLHLPRTHAVVQLFRAVLDCVAPQVLIITETNVPHADNIRYFGQARPESGRTDEAQLVYGFSLAPLTLHAFLSGDATRLRQWAATLQAPGPFLNFIASHDGIGLLPARGLLQPQEIDALVERTLAHGGKVSLKSNAPGQPPSPYELNITLYDFLNRPDDPDQEAGAFRFLSSQAIMLALSGVPGIYVHSLFGSSNWQAGLQATGQARSLNRQKFDYPALRSELEQPGTRPARLLSGYRRLLQARRNQRAFHPAGQQRVLQTLPPAVFGLVRSAPDGQASVLCLTNVSDARQAIRLDLAACGLPAAPGWRDLLAEQMVSSLDGVLEFGLQSYQTVWLAPVELNSNQGN